MTPEAQRIAIAEACGWTKVSYFAGFDDFIGTITRNGERVRDHIPYYLNDLNAMHEAENTLSFKQRHINYYGRLCQMSGGFPCFATAAQRAEAFLRTLNLWTE